MVEHGSARIWDVRWWHVTPEDAYDGVYGYIMHTVPIKCASGDFGLLFPTDMVKADFELPPTARAISFDNS